MSLKSKWESRITVPSATWTMDLTDSGGNDPAVAIAAAEYYHSSAGSAANDLPATIEAALNTAIGPTGTYTVTVSAGDGGTGKYTISCTDSFTLNWNDTELRDLLGFTGNLTPSATSFTGSDQAMGLWLPDSPVQTPYHLSSSGMVHSASLVTLSEDGTYYAFHGSKHVKNQYEYLAITQEKMIEAAETTTNASYEKFWKDCIRGEQSWSAGGREVRFYKDVDDDATFKTYNWLTVDRPGYTRMRDDWDGLWNVVFEVVEN